MSAATPLLAVSDLRVSYRVAGLDLPALGFKARHVQAVNGVSLAIDAGDTLGIVGESGCGKSTLARAILGLTQVESGEVRYDGALITPRERLSLARLRGQVAMIFQDPYASLNPRMPVGEALAEVLRVHRKVEPQAIEARVADLLRLVGLSPQMAQRRPHQLSGGQCQRAGIARALAIEPRLIIADECVAALDVSIQAQILNLLLELQQSMKLALIFISHDLGVVRHLCRRIAIMYLGQVVEEGLTEEVFAAPRHPYTRALLAAVPDTNPDHQLAPQTLRGDPPSPLDLPTGCAFHPRCPHCEDICASGTRPTLRAARMGQVACHFDF
ncbi:ATP-binding cassette domain-containing protein [Nordella sp. HKS 07]|uniref:ABC transporter ATP-binding protein n=1 Tax=Nordella sp. HKS 07 TaxID=2712222 RepID=UPI0013E1A80C|nr:oligopeptide/dipeptide ABC transporter ATP-binding protein [Nordella sp. HKS 07]QIG51898.1 ATP-binding cassette domain-containing protein [Nordella sp. HKS 07]